MLVQSNKLHKPHSHVKGTMKCSGCNLTSCNTEFRKNIHISKFNQTKVYVTLVIFFPPIKG